MIIRDIDVLSKPRAGPTSVTFSVPTLDHEIWRTTEPGTAPPRQRLRALSRLVEAGIDASVGMAPILPGLSDRPELLADVVKAARDAGATSIWTNVLYLRPGTREHFLENLARDWPELVPRYERQYAGRAYLPKADRAGPPRGRRPEGPLRDRGPAPGAPLADRPPPSRTSNSSWPSDPTSRSRPSATSHGRRGSPDRGLPSGLS